MGRKREKKKEEKNTRKQGQGINLEIVMWDTDTPNIQQLNHFSTSPYGNGNNLTRCDPTSLKL